MSNNEPVKPVSTWIRLAEEIHAEGLTAEALRRGLANLDGADRECIELRYGLRDRCFRSAPEVAREMGISTGRVRQRLSRGLYELQANLGIGGSALARRQRRTILGKMKDAALGNRRGTDPFEGPLGQG